MAVGDCVGQGARRRFLVRIPIWEMSLDVDLALQKAVASKADAVKRFLTAASHNPV